MFAATAVKRGRSFRLKFTFARDSKLNKAIQAAALAAQLARDVYQAVNHIDDNQIVVYVGTDEIRAIRYISDRNNYQYNSDGSETFCGAKLISVRLESHFHVTSAKFMRG